jgi:hypothetical protein
MNTFIIESPFKMSMEELYATVTKAQEAKEAKYNEIKKKEKEERLGQFKDVQKEFVEHITKLAEQKIKEVSADSTYLKKYVDIFQFSLPPKKTETQTVEFNGHLCIELMEGSKDSGYEDYFNSLNTVPTIDFLKKAFAPLNIHYGYYYKFGNVIQVRWDDITPRWALSKPEQFEAKKAASRKGKQGVRRINNKKNWQNQPAVNLKNPFDMMYRMHGMQPRRGGRNFSSNRTVSNNNQVHQRGPPNRKYSRGPYKSFNKGNVSSDYGANVSHPVSNNYDEVEE